MKSSGISGMDAAWQAERRAFLRTLTATTAALAVGGCGGGGTSTASGSAPATPPPSGPNLPPVWQAVTTIAFTQGVASSVSIAAYVSDSNGDALTITKNASALPPGVTFDAANKRFVYDGVGAVFSTGGHILTANDGRP